MACGPALPTPTYRPSVVATPEDGAVADARTDRLTDATLEAARPRVPRLPARRLGPIALASALLMATAALGATQGAAGIPASDILRILFDQLPLVSAEGLPETWGRIVFDVRLPRVVAAGVVGAALAFSGATYQGVFRNPLAGPFLLGVASGAALGAAIAIISPLESGTYGFGWVPLLAFVGAGGRDAVVYVLFARRADGFSNTIADPRGHRALRRCSARSPRSSC